MRGSPIARDTLLITDSESGVKRRVPNILLECSIQQLHNELINSLDNKGLIVSRHSNKNDVIISDTMLCSLAPPQLRTMTDHHKMMCGCAICNTSNYFQWSLNAWRRKQLKIMKYKVDNSSWGGGGELTQAHKSYANYAFPNDETRHPRCKNAADYVIFSPNNDECQLPNCKCVLRKFTSCTSIVLPVVERDPSNQAPMIMFNTYITQFTCSRHGILIRKKSPLVGMQMDNLKRIVSYVRN